MLWQAPCIYGLNLEVNSLKNRTTMSSFFSHEYFMKIALAEAEKAFEKQEVPVGAVVVCENRIVAKAHNLTERLNDVSAHAEMQAITAAANYLGNKYLKDCTLYVTLEPCVMCAGAMYWAQLGKLVYGANDEKRGASRLNCHLFHPKTKIESGVLQSECAAVLSRFFAQKRGLNTSLN